MAAPQIAGAVAPLRRARDDVVVRPPIDVIVLGWRDGDRTIAALRSLGTSTYPNVRVLVVDNGSDDGSDERVLAEMQRQWPGVVHLDAPQDRVDPTALWDQHRRQAPGADGGRAAVFIRSHRNRGYSGGMNLGLRVARAISPAAYVWLLTNDVLVDPGALDALVERCQRDPRIGLCGVTQHLRNRHGVEQTVPGGFRYVAALGWNLDLRCTGTDDRSRRRIERRMNAIQGSAVFASGELIDRVGLLEADRFVYFEEPEWAIRARRAGFRLAWAPGATIRNQHSETMVSTHVDRTARLCTVHYLMARGGVVFTKRHHPWLLPSVVAARLVRSVEDVVRKGPAVGWHSALGVIDGLRGRHRRLASLGDALVPTGPGVRTQPVPLPGGQR